MMKKIILIAVLLLFLPFVLSAETEIYSETFEYNDSFANHGWVWGDTWGDIPRNPQVYDSYDMDSYVFGWNQSKTIGIGGTVLGYITRLIPQNISSGTVSYSYDLDDFGTLSDSVTSYTFSLTNEFFTDLLIVRHGYNDAVNPDGGITRVDNNIGGDDCQSTFNYSTRFRANFVLQLDIDNNYYNAYYLINGTELETLCTGVTLHGGTMTELAGIKLLMNYQKIFNETRFWDNILVSSEFVNQTIFSVGQPCEGDEDCFSGNCEYGFCAYQTGGEDCDSDSDCLSGSCANGKCMKADMWNRIDASKKQQFGDSSNTNNFIALFFMLGLPILIILSTRSRAGVLGGVAVYFGLAFFFTIVGYLSVFILLGSIISALLIFVMVMIMKGGDS